MKVLIGTTNPGKIQGAKEALEVFFKDIEITGVKVPSNVADQPVNEDTYNGARNRVDNLIEYAKQNNIEADYYLGVESGICNFYNTWMIVNFAVIKDKDGYESVGIGPAFPVPKTYVEEIIATSLGQVLDKIYSTSASVNETIPNTKHTAFIITEKIDKIFKHIDTIDNTLYTNKPSSVFSFLSVTTNNSLAPSKLAPHSEQ